MQTLIWTDKDELDVIDRTDEFEMKKAKEFYKVGNGCCFNSCFGFCYGTILNIDYEKNTFDVWIKEKDGDYPSAVKFKGKTIIYHIPLSALY